MLEEHVHLVIRMKKAKKKHKTLKHAKKKHLQKHGALVSVVEVLGQVLRADNQGDRVRPGLQEVLRSEAEQ